MLASVLLQVHSPSAEPFFIGTGVYAGIGLAVLLLLFLLRDTLKIDFGLATVMVVMATICMWLIWAVTWLAQWHPLIMPIKEEPK